MTDFQSLFTGDTYTVPQQRPGEMCGRIALRALHAVAGTHVRLVVLGVEGFDPEALREEILTYAKIEHPHLSIPMDVVRDDRGIVGMVYAQHKSVSAADVMQKRNEGLPEDVALAILREAMVALDELHSADLDHGYIDAQAIRILGQERILIDHIIPPAVRPLFVKPEWLFQDIFHPGAPASVQDRYAIGVVFLSLCSEGFLQLIAGGDVYRKHLLQHGFTEQIAELKNLSQPSKDVLSCLVNNVLERRYQDNESCRRDLVRAISGYTARIARDRESAGPAQVDVNARSDVFNTSDIQQHIGIEKQRDPATELRIERKALKSMAKMVLVNLPQLEASINLAPGASFPRILLEALLKETKVTYGIDQAALDEATVPKQEVRHLVLARGKPPQPGVPGRTVRDEEIVALEASIRLEIKEGGMVVELLSVPDYQLAAEDVHKSLADEGVTVGIVEEAFEQLTTSGADASGRTLIAQGKPAVPSRDAAFYLCDDQGKIPDDQDSLQYRVVSKGARVAQWLRGEFGVPGSTCLGEVIEVAEPENNDPMNLAGEGIDTKRKGAELELLSTRDGVVHRELSGAVKVVGVQQVYGDFEDIESDELVMIHGDVPDGVRVSSSVGIIVMGNVGDAELTTGGDCRVHGRLNGGEQQVQAAGHVHCESVGACTLIAGRLTVDEEIDGAKAVVLGNCTARHVKSGSVVAAGDIRLHEAGITGDDDSVADGVDLWAGHHVPIAIERELNQLQEKKLVAERGRMVEERNEIAEMLDDIRRNEYRFTVGGYIQKEHLRQIQDRLTRIKVRGKYIEEALEHAREDIVDKKEQVADLREGSDNSGAHIAIEQAHTGIVVRLAQAEARVLEKTQDSFFHRISHNT